MYRFGLRLTYDLIVPEPGAAMRRAYMELEKLRNQLGPFVFNVKYSDITEVIVDKDGNPPASPAVPKKPKYLWLADEYDVAVKLYPDPPSTIFLDVNSPGNNNWIFLDTRQFDIPKGQMIKDIHVDAIIGKNEDRFPHFKIIGAMVVDAWQGKSDGLFLLAEPVFEPDGITPFMWGVSGSQKITLWFSYTSGIQVRLKIFLRHTTEAIEQWRLEVWNALYNAAQTKYYAKQQDIAAKISALEEKLANVDTLTLRREESDEIMKCVLRMYVDTDHINLEPIPDDFFKPPLKPETAELIKHGVSSDMATSELSNPNQWAVIRQHQNVNAVRFINQAIEWENVVTFLYSYFWDIPNSWAFIRDLRHSDSTRQAFLRAGSARVVLTVRKGWEEKWLRFASDGTIDADVSNPSTGPYLTIAQEIAAYDDRNYPGIPPANPAKTAVRLQDAVYTTSSAMLAPSPAPVSIPVASSAGFTIGLKVVLDVETIQEAVVIVDIPKDSNNEYTNIIVVANLTQPHNGTQEPFPVLQPGHKGALIAEWNEYTPSSGTDIAVTSNLTTIA